MKKLLTISLAIFFTLSAIGIRVTVHRCMGKTSFAVFGVDFNKDCKCRHENESHRSRCCNSHTVIFKATVDPFTTALKTIAFQQVSIDKMFVKAHDLFLAPSLSNVQSIAFAHAPPERTTSLNALFCVYRI